MKSAAHFRGHPIHPMLVAFPMAFLYGAPGFDLAGRLLNWPGGWATGAYLNVAAIAAGLIAAVPGLVDYRKAVPPHSSAKSRATQHMIANSSALVAFAVSWLFRNRSTLEPGGMTILVEAAGVTLVTWGGWLGGTLVYRNQIGVDHRFANAGRWKEETIGGAADTSLHVVKNCDLEVDQMMLLHVDNRRIVLARTEQGYVAFDDRCSHKGGSLADGVMICETVQCPWHGSQFDVRNGEVKAGPAREPIKTYRVEEGDGEIRLDLAR